MTPEKLRIYIYIYISQGRGYKQGLLRQLRVWGSQEEGGWKGRSRKGKQEANLREQNGQNGETTETESKERGILTEGAVMELSRSLAQENSLESTG